MFRRIHVIALSLLITVLNPAHADTAFTQRQDVQSFINKMVTKHHFQRDYLENLFNQVKYHVTVIQQVKKPLEANPWLTYQRMFITESRIRNGVKFWDKHAAALQKAEQIYGVPASIIVATLGVETKYGENTGNYRVIDSLTSIGFSSSPRALFFRSELEQFLLLSREQHLNPMTVTGSYAGAIGMPQFIASSYRYYAASFTNHKPIDLMNNVDDVIASVANYYKENGWTKNMPVAVPATVNVAKYSQMPKPANPKQEVLLKTLAKYGVTPDRQVANENVKGKLIVLNSDNSKEYWVGFHNFDVIKRYNPNDLYAMAVYQLSHHIKDLKERS